MNASVCIIMQIYVNTYANICKCYVNLCNKLCLQLAKNIYREHYLATVTSFRFVGFFHFLICCHHQSLFQEFSSSFCNIPTCAEDKIFHLLTLFFVQLIIPIKLITKKG